MADPSFLSSGTAFTRLSRLSVVALMDPSYSTRLNQGRCDETHDSQGRDDPDQDEKSGVITIKRGLEESDPNRNPGGLTGGVNAPIQGILTVEPNTAPLT
jgi:hypothetical protein